MLKRLNSTKYVSYQQIGQNILSRAKVSWVGRLRFHTLALTGVLQLSLPARCRLEVISGTIRERRLPRVCQWNMRPGTSASSWLGLFLPLCSWEVWKGGTPKLTLLCPACHLTFMLDVSSPATAVQSPRPWHQTRRMHCLKLWPRTWGKRKETVTGQKKIHLNIFTYTVFVFKVSCCIGRNKTKTYLWHQIRSFKL